MTLAPQVAAACKPCAHCGTPVLHLFGATLVDPIMAAGRAGEARECAASPSGWHRWETRTVTAKGRAR